MEPELSDSNEPQPTVDVYSLAVFTEGGLAVAAGVVGWLIGVSPFATMARPERGWPEAAAAAGWGLAAAAPLALSLALIDRFPFGPLGRLRHVVRERVAPLFENLTRIQLAVVSLLAGLGEEMLFRGVMQAALTKWIGPPAGVWLGLATASLAFGLCHYLTTTYFVVASLIGLYLGALFLWTDHLLAPIVAHAAYDFFALCLLLRTRLGRSPME
jgi:membrane protease YdiL (CAAX protease family)